MTSHHVWGWVIKLNGGQMLENKGLTIVCGCSLGYNIWSTQTVGSIQGFMRYFYLPI
jgi:hypothetical protein